MPEPGGGCGGTLHTVAPAAERGREEEHGSGHRDEHDEDTGVRERPQEEEREHQQRTQRHRDRDTAEHDGPPGHDGRPDHRRLLIPARRAFLTVAVDHEQAVVDAESEAEYECQVRAERRHLGEAREQAQSGEGAEDGEQADSDGQQGGRGAPVDEDQQKEYGGQREGLRAQEVGAGLLTDLPGDLLLAACADVQFGCGAGQPG